MKEMTFWEHIEELRKTLMRVALILLIAFLITVTFVDQITEFLLEPLRTTFALSPNSGQIVFHSIFEKAMVQLDVSIFWAIFFSAPFWFYEIWKFIKPGLYKNEIRVVGPFLLFGLFLFLAGVISGYLILPYIFKFLMALGVNGVSANINLRDYVSTVSKVLLLLGVIFQVPNILLILGFMGIVTKQFLRAIRRFVYVGLAVFAAIFSPPDVFSMLMVWVPLCILYEVGVILVAWIVHPWLYRQQQHHEKNLKETNP